MFRNGQGLRRSVACLFLAPMLCWMGSLQAQATGVAPEQVVLGRSGDLTGQLNDLGQEVLKGAQLYFDALNARGGVHGRKVRLVAKDDAYDPRRTLMNVNGYVESDDT